LLQEGRQFLQAANQSENVDEKIENLYKALSRHRKAKAASTHISLDLARLYAEKALADKNKRTKAEANKYFRMAEKSQDEDIKMQAIQERAAFIDEFDGIAAAKPVEAPANRRRIVRPAHVSDYLQMAKTAMEVGKKTYSGTIHIASI
jgi:hypothetical protein